MIFIIITLAKCCIILFERFVIYDEKHWSSMISLDCRYIILGVRIMVNFFCILILMIIKKPFFIIVLILSSKKYCLNVYSKLVECDPKRHFKFLSYQKTIFNKRSKTLTLNFFKQFREFDLNQQKKYYFNWEEHLM